MVACEVALETVPLPALPVFDRAIAGNAQAKCSKSVMKSDAAQ